MNSSRTPGYRNGFCMRQHFPTTPENRRAGASLVEILMALMVMSIGLVSVATMFPVSMLRSLQATQLTNSALLNYQCQDYVAAFPQLVYNDFNPAYPDAVPGYGTDVLPNVVYTDRNPTFGRLNFANSTEYFQNLPLNFVSIVDPIGYSFLLANLTDARTYGKDLFNLHTEDDLFFQSLRTNAGFNLTNTAQKNLAFSMFASGDSWSVMQSSIEVGITSATVLQLNDMGNGDLQTFLDSVNAGITGRVVVFDQNRRQSHVSQVSAVNPTTREITLLEAVPNNGLYSTIPEVRLELLEPRYTCLITVRRQLINLGPAGTPGADGVDDDNSDNDNNIATDADGFGEVGWPGSDDTIRSLGANLVVFFRRDFSPLSEQVFEAGNLIRGVTNTTDAQPVTIRWSSANSDSKPRIRTGNYVFDPVNGYWYKISTVLVEQQAATNAVNAAVNDLEAVILLDRPPEASGNYLMVPERVVEVYDFPTF